MRNRCFNNFWPSWERKRFKLKKLRNKYSEKAKNKGFW